ncbi:putative membrane protein [Hyphomicrobiales bacterium]|nr:putative membrane protein [Hyphomicrobiales bacterium]CAH1670377.1 putative membrane protein [Hyphomicrobiales bacterium]
MFGLPLAFTAPLVLAALATLPAIWLMLRVTPPQPRRIAFPPLAVITDILPKQETPARTPWWLLLLRLLIAALLILAAAGPVWNPPAGEATASSGPVLLLVDNDFAAAGDWQARVDLAAGVIATASRNERPVAVVALGGPLTSDVTMGEAGQAAERLRAIAPLPFSSRRNEHLTSIGAFLNAQPEAEIVWVTSGIRVEEDQFVSGLAAIKGSHPVTVYRREASQPFALAATANVSAGFDVTVVRPTAEGRDRGTLRAVDLKGLPLGETPFTFPAGATEASARFALPVEIRNAITRVEIVDENSAGAVSLVGDDGKRRSIGLVSGASADVAQPLLAPTYYVARALQPFAELREPRGGVAEAIGALIEQQVSVIVLTDVGVLDSETVQRLTRYVEDGGVLVRFAGSRLAAGNDALVPVKLRRGGRSLGGSLSWDTPKALAPFGQQSPFADLPVPTDVSVQRQILAEPDGNLAARTWASLSDGTPIVTAERRGEGEIVLFHVTADPSWSNLPMSGLFVEMLRKIVQLAGTPATESGTTSSTETVAPRHILNGFGVFSAPPATAKPVPRGYAGRATPDHPAGLYGPNEGLQAVNVLTSADRLSPLDITPLAADVRPIAQPEAIDLRGGLITAALILLALDTLIAAWMGGHLGRFGRRRGAAAASITVFTVAAALASIALMSPGVAAETPPKPAASSHPPLRQEDIASALHTRLAYVITGDQQVDATSRAGLLGLTDALMARTTFEPAEPIGIDPSRDELSFYPLIYWPVVAGRPLPPDAAMRRLDTFMKNGGTVIFDTRDALRANGQTSPETQQLRRMLASLDIPELEPVPPDHVLTKAFYLLETFPGRYDRGTTWVEALPPVVDGERRPARAGDGVSPIVITGNDLAAAWAVGSDGSPLFPVLGPDPRQREMSFRSGINIVMYALTGNYKADQVHVPALLERLGQ